MSTKSLGCASRKNHILQVGPRHALSMELKVVSHGKVVDSCLHSAAVDIVSSNLMSLLKDKVVRKKKDIKDKDMIKDGELLISYKFHKSATRDLVTIPKQQILECSVGRSARQSFKDSSKYQSIILFPEKLIVTVIMEAEAESDSKSLTHDKASIDSGYFTDMKKLKESHKKKKETLKKVSNCMSDKSKDNDENVQPKPTKNLQTILDNFIRKDTEKISFNTNKTSDAISDDVIVVDKKSSDVTSCSSRLRLRNRKVNTNIEKETILKRNSTSIKELLEDNVSKNEKKNILDREEELEKEGESQDIEKLDEYPNAAQNKKAAFSDTEDFSDTTKPTKRKKPLKTYGNKRLRTSKRVINVKNKPEDAFLSLISINESQSDSPVKKFTMDTLLNTKVKTVEKMKDITDVSKFVDDTTLEDDTESDATCAADVKSIKHLSCEQLQRLVKSFEKPLRRILKGETLSERHDIFKKGGKEKAILGVNKIVGLLNEEQEDALSQTLLQMFCSKSSLYFDYVMKVLLPEVIAMIYSHVNEVTIEQANQIIMANF